MRFRSIGIAALGLLFGSFAIATPIADHTHIVVRIDEAVANIRKNFPGEIEERLGRYRAAYLRLAVSEKIRSLIAQDQKLGNGLAPLGWIYEWHSVDPGAGTIIYETSKAFDIDMIPALTAQLAVSAFKAGKWDEGRQLIEWAGPKNLSPRQWAEVATEHARGGRLKEAETYFANVNLPVSFDEGRNYAFNFGRVGFVYGVRSIAESYDGEKNVALIFAAAINGASLEQRSEETEILIRQLIGGRTRGITIERLIEGQGDGWSPSLRDCRQGIKPVNAPSVASQTHHAPIFDCFPTETGLVPGLATAAFRAGKRELAIELLDRGSAVLLERIPWDDGEFVRQIRFGERRPTSDDLARMRRYENLISSLVQMAAVAGTVESPELGRKLLPTLQARRLLSPGFLFAFRNDPSELQTFLSMIEDNIRVAWRFDFLRLAIKQNNSEEAIKLFRAAFENINDRGLAFWIFYEQFRSAPNETTDAIKNWYIESARTAITRSDTKSYEVWAFRNFAFEVGEFSLLKELGLEAARRRQREIASSPIAQHPRSEALTLAQAALDCFQADRSFAAESLIGDEKDEAKLGYFQAYMVDVYAQTDQIDKASELADKMSAQYPDIRFYPDYLREAWGHLAYGYARQGNIHQALAIIGEGKAGKDGGTIDAVVDAWIAAGYYKRQ